MKNICLTENKHSWEDLILYFGQLPIWWTKSLLNGVSCVPAWATCQKRTASHFYVLTYQRTKNVSMCQKACQFFNLSNFSLVKRRTNFAIIFQMNFSILNFSIKLNIWDDTHMSMKIVQFSRPPTPSPPLVHLHPKFFHPLYLERPNDNQLIKRKHNPSMTIICYQVLPSGRISFSISTH